jgi:glycosyltransferase involved in cell wall biosynthesis
VKIVQVQTQAELAGAQRVSDMVGEGLRRQGHDVRTVFMYRKTDAYDRDPHADFILDHKPSGPIELLKAAGGLIKYMRRARPDAVISYQHYGNIAGTIAGRLAGAKHLIANQSGAPGRHGGWPATLADTLMGVAGLYDYSVVNSGWLAAQFETYPANYRKRLRRIDHGVEPVGKLADKRAARRSFDLPDNAYLLISSGRLTEDKNQAAIVAALPTLPDVHLALAGAGPQREALSVLAAKRGVADRLHFVGEVPRARMSDFLAAGDLYVFASRTETFGLAVAEAAIAGLPIVANGLDVLREVLGSAALYVDVDQGGELAAAVARIKGDALLQAELVDAGRALATRYSPAAMTQSYAALLA